MLHDIFYVLLLTIPSFIHLVQVKARLHIWIWYVGVKNWIEQKRNWE